jgi:hypothetical protein
MAQTKKLDPELVFMLFKDQQAWEEWLAQFIQMLERQEKFYQQKGEK